LWQWDQFVDHDIDLTDGTDPADIMYIPVPVGDPEFDPAGSGVVTMPMNRSLFDPATGLDTARQQTNEITARIDASNVYGSDAERAAALRENDASGRLKISTGNRLPFNTEGLANAGGNSPELFLAGDVRANEQVGELIHAVLVRQFTALRDGDRFWYERTLSRSELQLVNNSQLADIIRRNTDIGNEIQDDVFHVATSTPVQDHAPRTGSTRSGNRPRRR
jgi:Animal haem peroxidase